IEKNVGRARQHEVGREAKGPKHQPLEKTAPEAMGRRGDHLTDTHAVTSDELLSAIIDREGDREEDKPYHEEGAIVNAAPNYFAHFLGNNSGHGVHRLEKSAEPLSEIRNCYPVSSTEQDDHRLANYATKPQQNRRYDSGKRRGHEHAHNRLEAIRAERIGSFLEAARHVTKRIFRQRKNGRHRHEGEQTTGRKNVEPLAAWKERHPLHEGSLG